MCRPASGQQVLRRDRGEPRTRETPIRLRLQIILQDSGAGEGEGRLHGHIRRRIRRHQPDPENQAVLLRKDEGIRKTLFHSAREPRFQDVVGRQHSIPGQRTHAGGTGRPYRDERRRQGGGDNRFQLHDDAYVGEPGGRDARHPGDVHYRHGALFRRRILG